MINLKKTVILFSIFLANTSLSLAAQDYALPASEMSLFWAIPFIGILGSLALMPILLPKIWHPHYGKIALFWASFVVLPLIYFYGMEITLHSVLHTYLLEYVPFILVALALFTISGGIKIQLATAGTPFTNTIFLVFASLVASLIGTTGAAMLFIRPLLTINKHRGEKVHIVLFFILLVCNIGGSLTALGDPPLFLGFLKGVPFLWPFYHLLVPFTMVSLPLLVIFYMVDFNYFRSENKPAPKIKQETKIEGGINFVLLALVMTSVIISGNWKPGIFIHVYGVELELQNILRDISFILFSYCSMKITSKSIRTYNLFSWEPIFEVAKLFASIFITAMPVLTILGAGSNGALASIVDLVNTNGQPNNIMYFWLTGLLSSILDNAPTYLVFFYMAGGDALELSGPMSQTLTAISAGAVFMGALTYIGNAPNFLVKSIAELNGIQMPSFFKYAAFSCITLLPLFLVISFLLF